MGAIFKIFFRTLSAFPLAVRLVLLAAMGFGLYTLLMSWGWIMQPLAITAWCLAAVGLLWASGMLPFAERIPALAKVLDRYAPSSHARSRVDVRTTSPAPRPVERPVATTTKPAGESNRDMMRAEAETQLGDIAQTTGQVAPCGQVEELANQAVFANQRGLAGFGTHAPAVVLVFYGPRGTGKSRLARLSAQLLYGVGAIKRPDIVDLSQDAVLSYGTLDAKAIAETLQRSLDATLLLDDCDWLIEDTPDGRASNLGVQILSQITAFAERNPGRLLIICVASEAAGKPLATDSSLRLWRGKVDLRGIPFGHIDDGALSLNFERFLVQKRIRLTPDATKQAKRIFAVWRGSDGKNFRNLHAVRELSDKAFTAMSRRAIEQGSAAAEAMVTIADLEAAAEELRILH
jgi:hypothetical protein